MSQTPAPIPPGYEAPTPSLVIRGAAKAIEFYKELFGATEIVRMNYPDSDRVMHAELKFGKGTIMLGDESPQFGALAPQPGPGQPPFSLMVYAPDVDAVFAKATGLGVRVVMPPADMFWGDRFCKFVDPFGHCWGVATHVRDVPPEEMEKAALAFMNP
jgi:PhnB protein